MADATPSTSSARDSAVAILNAEHRALGNVVHILQRVIETITKGHGETDFQLIACMLLYLDSFPERCHHPKEDQHLFQRLRGRTSEADALLGELETQHQTGARLIARVEQAFVYYQGGASDGLQSFTEAVNAYADLQWLHMDLEENSMLPLAFQHLCEDDWGAIDNAFRANDDPLFGLHARKEFAVLRQRIVNSLPRKLKTQGAS